MRSDLNVGSAREVRSSPGGDGDVAVPPVQGAAEVAAAHRPPGILELGVPGPRQQLGDLVLVALALLVGGGEVVGVGADAHHAALERVGPDLRPCTGGQQHEGGEDDRRHERADRHHGLTTGERRCGTAGKIDGAGGAGHAPGADGAIV
jgi:hypothetical protein